MDTETGKLKKNDVKNRIGKDPEANAYIYKNKFKTHLLNFVVLVIALIQLFPLVWLLFFSLKDNSEIFGENIVGLPRHFLWQNYADAFSQGNVGRYLLNSILVTGLTIIFSDILAVCASYAIARMRWKLRRATMVLFLMGIMVPLHAALLPLFLVLKSLKLYNTIWALIVPYTAFTLSMGIFIFVGFMQSLPKELEESALIDGCTIYRAFFSIILPLVKPAIATVSIFTYLSAWNELMFAIQFVSKPELKTLTVGIMAMVGQYSTKWGPIGAGLVIATIPTLVIYILMSNQVQKSFITGAVKG
ncbi:MAG TPA: carbohydrate ABC transporter permease [Clostridia bacterium]|nr:carbohydrate ABC transporter permease [Clostridia bacterium]